MNASPVSIARRVVLISTLPPLPSAALTVIRPASEKPPASSWILPPASTPLAERIEPKDRKSLPVICAVPPVLLPSRLIVPSRIVRAARIVSVPPLPLAAIAWPGALPSPFSELTQPIAFSVSLALPPLPLALPAGAALVADDRSIATLRPTCTSPGAVIATLAATSDTLPSGPVCMLAAWGVPMRTDWLTRSRAADAVISTDPPRASTTPSTPTSAPLSSSFVTASPTWKRIRLSPCRSSVNACAPPKAMRPICAVMMPSLATCGATNAAMPASRTVILQWLVILAPARPGVPKRSAPPAMNASLPMSALVATSPATSTLASLPKTMPLPLIR